MDYRTWLFIERHSRPRTELRENDEYGIAVHQFPIKTLVAVGRSTVRATVGYLKAKAGFRRWTTSFTATGVQLTSRAIMKHFPTNVAEERKRIMTSVDMFEIFDRDLYSNCAEPQGQASPDVRDW